MGVIYKAQQKRTGMASAFSVAGYKRMILSASAVNASSCEIYKRVLLVFSIKLCNQSKLCASSVLVGSSKMSTSVSLNRQRAIEIYCFSPPDKWLLATETCRSAKCSRCNCRIIWSTFSISARSLPKMMFSFTVPWNK